MPQLRMNFRQRINLNFLFLVSFSLVLSITFSSYLYSLRITDEIKPRLIDGLSVVHAQFDSIRDKSIVYSDIFNDNPVISDYLGGGSSRDEFLDEVIRVSGRTDFDLLQIINAEGVVEARMENLSDFGDSKKDDPLFRNILKDQRQTDSVFIDGKLAIAAAFPFKEEGQMLGAIVAGYFIDNNLLKHFRSFVGAEVAILKNGRPLAASFTAAPFEDWPKQFGLDERTLKEIDRNLENNPYLIRKLKTPEKEYLTAFAPLKTTNGITIATLMTSLDLKSVKVANERMVTALLLTAVLTLFLALILASRLSTRLAQPLSFIQNGAKLLGGGNLKSQIEVKTGDEFEELAAVFNKMAADLKVSIEKIENDKDEIAAERNKLSLILSGVADGVIALDSTRRVLLFNPGAEKLTGLSSQSVLGRHINRVLRISRNHGQPISVNEFCPIPAPPGEADRVIFHDKNLAVAVVEKKKEFHANVLSATIKEAEKINLGCILTLHDVSEEHELEQMKLDFVSMAAHELRTPLTAIAGYLSLLQEELGDSFNADQKMYFDRVKISTKQLQTLIDNLLDVTKIERGNLTLEIKAERWPPILEETLANYRDYARQKGIELELEPLPSDLPLVRVDKFRIAEVVSNLLSNAINFTPRNGRVTVSVAVKKNEVVTNVTDSGPGIPASSLPKLFTKFYRVSGTLSEGSKGTGLGLFISKAIVELHQGKIWVKSRLKLGSSFFFSVPASPQAGNDVE